MNMHASTPRMAPAASRSRPSRWTFLAFGGVGTLLLWAIVSRSLVPAFGPAAPTMTLALRPGDPAAVIAFVQTELGASDQRAGPAAADKPSEDSKRTLADLRLQLEAALAIEPLNARLYSLLGVIADRSGDDARAVELMKAATRLSLHETIAIEWLMRERFRAKDYAGATDLASLLLKNDHLLVDFAAPVLTRIAENPEAAAEVEKLLASTPPWRSYFLEKMTDSLTDARTPLRLMLALKEAGTPPTASDVRRYLAFLFRHKQYQLAYYTWLQFLPTDQLETVGPLFNGGFTSPLSGMPFDWNIVSGVGYTADVIAKPDAQGDYALNVQFGEGRVEFNGVSQAIMLTPGDYTFKGAYRGNVIGPRGLQWIISCLDANTFARSPMVLGTFPAWRSFEFPFTVPDKDCSAQEARLVLAARSASEQLVSGSIWFDDLSIVRAERAVK